MSEIKKFGIGRFRSNDMQSLSSNTAARTTAAASASAFTRDFQNAVLFGRIESFMRRRGPMRGIDVMYGLGHICGVNFMHGRSLMHNKGMASFFKSPHIMKMMRQLGLKASMRVNK